MNTPTIKELQQSITNALTSRLGISLSPNSSYVIRSIANAIAGVVKILYLAIAKVEQNIYIDTADADTLQRFGIVELGRGRFNATQGRYTATATGLDGAVIPAQSLFRGDDASASPGSLYTNEESVTISGTTQNFEVRAIVAGIGQSLNLNDTITATQPLTNIDDQVLISGVIAAPTEAETLENYRDEVIQGRRLEAEGGSQADYRKWASDAVGVLRTYPYAVSGQINVVRVYVESAQLDSVDGKGTPTDTILNAAEAVIRLNPNESIPIIERFRLPSLVTLEVQPVIIQDVEITIGQSTNINDDDKVLIESSLRQYVLEVRPFVSGADLIGSLNDTISVNGIITSIQAALIDPSKRFEDVTLTVGGISVLTSFRFDNGNIPYLNNVAYI